MEQPGTERILLSKGWLSREPRTVQADVLRHGRLLQFAAGEYAYRMDEMGGGIHGIVGGGLAIYVASATSGPHLAHILRTGIWIGQSTILSGRRRVVSAQALEPTKTWYLPLDALERLASSKPGFANALGRLSDDSFRIAASGVADLLIRRADRRIAATLLRVTGVQDGETPDDPSGFRLTQAELGEMANTSRHLVNRTLRRFETAGWLKCGYNRIAVRKPRALAAFVRDGE